MKEKKERREMNKIRYVRKDIMKVGRYQFIIENRCGAEIYKMEQAKNRLSRSLRNVPESHLDILGENLSFIFYSNKYFNRTGQRYIAAFVRGEYDHSYICLRSRGIGAQTMTHEIGHAIDYNLSDDDEKFWIRKWKDQQAGIINSIGKRGYHMRHPGEFFAVHYEMYYEDCVGKRLFDKEILNWFDNFNIKEIK